MPSTSPCDIRTGPRLRVMRYQDKARLTWKRSSRSIRKQVSLVGYKRFERCFTRKRLLSIHHLRASFRSSSPVSTSTSPSSYACGNQRQLYTIPRLTVIYSFWRVAKSRGGGVTSSKFNCQGTCLWSLDVSPLLSFLLAHSHGVDPLDPYSECLDRGHRSICPKIDVRLR